MGKDFDDLDDDFFNMDDEVDEGEDGKRKPLKTKLKKTGKDFLDDFKHTPIVDQAKEVGEGFTNTVIGEDNIRAFEEAKKALEDSTKGLRKTSSALLENTAKKLGSDTVLGRVADKIANAIYTKESERSGGYTKSDDDIAREYAGRFATDRTDIDKSQAKLIALQESVTNENTKKIIQSQLAQFNLTKYGISVSEKYYKQSLELKYRHVLEAKKQTGLLVTEFNNVITKLSAIEHNTMLPDLIKMKSSEVLKARAMSNIMDSIYKPMGRYVKRSSIYDLIRSRIDGIVGGIESGLGMADMASSMGGGMGLSAGSMAASFGRGTLGSLLAKKLMNTKMGQEYLNKTGTIKLSPTGFLNAYSDKVGSDTFLGKTLAGMASFLSPSMDLKTSLNADREGLDEPSAFDVRTKESINIVPTLLGNILGEVRAIRTHTEPEEVKYDHLRQKFIPVKNVKNEIFSNIREGFKNLGIASHMESFFNLADKNSTVKLTDAEKKKLSRRLYNRISDPSFSLTYLKDDDKLFKNMSEEEKSKYYTYLTSAQKTGKKLDIAKSRELSDKLANVLETRLVINERLEQLIKSGFGPELAKAKLVIYDKSTGKYYLNEGIYDSISASQLSKMLGIEPDKSVKPKDEFKDTVAKTVRSKVESAKENLNKAGSVIRPSMDNAKGFVSSKYKNFKPVVENAEGIIVDQYKKYKPIIDKDLADLNKKIQPFVNDVEGKSVNLYNSLKENPKKFYQERIDHIEKAVKNKSTEAYAKIKSLVDRYGANVEDITLLSKEFGLSINDIEMLYKKHIGKEVKSLKDELKEALDKKNTKKTKLGDTDNDGIREGSWLSIIKSRKEEKKQAKTFAEKIKKNNKKSGGILGIVGGLIATLFGGVGLGASVLKAIGGTIFNPIKTLFSTAVTTGLKAFLPKNIVISALKAIISLPKLIWNVGMGIRAGKNALIGAAGKTRLGQTIKQSLVTGIAGGIGGIGGGIAGGYLTDKYFHMSAKEHQAVKDFNYLISKGYSLEQADALLQRKYGITVEDLKGKISRDKYSGLADIGGSLAGAYLGNKALTWGAGKILSRGGTKVAEEGVKAAAKSGWLGKAGSLLLRFTSKFGGKGGKIGALIAGLGLLATYLMGGDEFDKKDISGVEKLQRKLGRPLTKEERAQADLRELGYMVPPNKLANKLMSDYTGKHPIHEDGGYFSSDMMMAGAGMGTMAIAGYGAHRLRKGSWRSMVSGDDIPVNERSADTMAAIMDRKRKQREELTKAKKIANEAKKNYGMSGIMKFLPKSLMKYTGKLGGVLKRLPFVGTAASLGSAALNLAKGNYGGAAMDVIASMAKFSPIGMALSLASIFLPTGDDKDKEKKKNTGNTLQQQLDDWRKNVLANSNVNPDDLYRNSKGELKPLSEMTTEELNKTKPHKGESGIRHYAKMMHENDKRRGWDKLTKNASLFAMMKSTTGFEVERDFHTLNGAQRIRAKKEYEEKRRKAKEEFFPEELAPSERTANLLKMKTLNTWESRPDTKGKNGIQRIRATDRWKKYREGIIKEYNLYYGEDAAPITGMDVNDAVKAKMQIGNPAYGSGKLDITYTHPDRGKWTDHMDPDTVRSAIATFKAWGKPIIITSAYRSPRINRGAKHSMHLVGKALDLEVSAWSTQEICQFIQIAGRYGFRGFGIYGARPSMLHIDTGGKRMWGNTFHRDSTPSWAIPCINKAHNEDTVDVSGMDIDTPMTNPTIMPHKSPIELKTKAEDTKGLSSGSSYTSFVKSPRNLSSGGSSTFSGNSVNIGSTGLMNKVYGVKGVRGNYRVAKADKILLDVIAKGEVGGYRSNNNGYDVAFGGKKYLHGVDPSKVTISEIYRLQKRIRRETAHTKYPTSAIGRYQFMYNTLRETVRRSGIPENTIFSPNVQDWLIVQRLNHVRGYKEWKAGKLSDIQFAMNLSKEFASIANPKTGKGNYKNQNALTTYEDLKEAFRQMRALGVGGKEQNDSNDMYIGGTPGIAQSGDNNTTPIPESGNNIGLTGKIATGAAMIDNVFKKAKDVVDSFGGSKTDMPIMLKNANAMDRGIPTVKDILPDEGGTDANMGKSAGKTGIDSILPSLQKPLVGEVKGSNRYLSELNKKMDILINEIKGSNQTIKKAVEKPKVVHTKEVIHKESDAKHGALDMLKEPNVSQIDVSSTATDSEDFSRLY